MGGEDGLHLDMAEAAGVTAVKISSSSSSPSSPSSITERIKRGRLFWIYGFPWLHLLIRHLPMRQPCVQLNVFQINDKISNIKDGLYTR